MAKPIQAGFGQVLIDAIADFARADPKSASELARDEFSHIVDAKMRQALAERLYGARWLTSSVLLC